MKKYIGIVIAIIGIGLLCFNLYWTVKNEANTTYYLMPLGLLLTILGTRIHMKMNKK